MPIRLIRHDGKPYAYKWGSSGKEYLVSKLGMRQAYNSAVNQMKAIYSSGYKKK